MQLEIPQCYDTVNDAIKAAVMALGGFKKVAGQLRPELENGGDWLRHCLAGDRRERLNPEQLIWILREARAIGFHGAMDFMAFATGYEAKPADPEQQVRDLQATIAAGLEQLNRQMANLGRLQAGGSR